MPRRVVIPDETRAAMRACYESGGSLEEAARLGGTTRQYLAPVARTEGWARRASVRRLPRPRPVPILPPAPPDMPLRDRLERLVGHRIGALELEAATGVVVDAEANARAIAANVRTLAIVRRLPQEPAPKAAAHDDPPPRTLDELRDELRRHLERIADEDRAGALDGDPRPDGAGADAGPLAAPLPAGAAPA